MADTEIRHPSWTASTEGIQELCKLWCLNPAGHDLLYNLLFATTLIRARVQASQKDPKSQKLHMSCRTQLFQRCSGPVGSTKCYFTKNFPACESWHVCGRQDTQYLFVSYCSRTFTFIAGSLSSISLSVNNNPMGFNLGMSELSQLATRFQRYGGSYFALKKQRFNLIGGGGSFVEILDPGTKSPSPTLILLLFSSHIQLSSKSDARRERAREIKVGEGEFVPESHLFTHCSRF